MTHVWVVTYTQAGLYGVARRVAGVFSTVDKAFAYVEALGTEVPGCDPMMDRHRIDAYANEPRST